MRRLIWTATGLVLFGCIAVQAQIVVFDPAITIRNTTTAIVKELLGELAGAAAAADSTDVQTTELVYGLAEVPAA